MKRPFSITLAKKVRWKTVKHMNKYFSHAERVVDAWREKGPQYLDPQLAYVGGGATPEEVARPHGIYLFRDGVPTNYFAPNFNPPYTTKMTRSLLFNVLGKSWDKKRREWVSTPIPKLITPSMLVSAMCGCTDNHASGFVATEATYVEGPVDRSTILPDDHAIRSMTPKTPKRKPFFDPLSPLASQKNTKKERSILKFDKDNKPIMTSTAQESPSKTVSASSASFEDGPQNDSIAIPSPFEEKDSKNHESRDPEPITMESDQNTRQALEPLEEGQNKQQEQQPEDDGNPADDENSGDAKNNIVKKNEDTLKKKPETQLASDEEWLKDVETSAKTEAMALQHAEQSRQVQVRSVVQVQSPTVRINNSSSKSTRTVEPALSMEYSVDESTLIGCDKSVGSSTLLGQNFDAESKSVISVPAKEPVVKETIKTVLSDVPEKSYHTHKSTVTAGSSASSTYSEQVPSDEELFAAGWAKTLDSSSGCYYYFTLDRKKTCWENPLAPPESDDETSVGDN